MNWLRSRLRKWLGIQNLSDKLDYHLLHDVANHSARIADLEHELIEFRAALKAKAAQVPQRPVYTDYESSQQAVLAEFEEKDGVHR